MSNVAATDTSNLMIARRLMEIEKKAEKRRKGESVDDKSALDYFKEDQALISSSAQTDPGQGTSYLPPIENINISLADMRTTGKEPGAVNPAQENGTPEAGFTVTSTKSVEIKLELRVQSNKPLEGLVVHDQNYAESDRYLFKFADGSTFTILDKWTHKSTTVWGDPHVDVDDVAGDNNGDFQDLKGSEDFTTFMLMDGTRLTFKAKDNGIIEQVDIFKGSQHVKGLGSASSEFSPETGLFSTNMTSNEAYVANKTPMGDLVFAGGDGNDWFDSSNKLVWGKTTGPVVTHRPLATLELYYRQTVSQSITIQTLLKDA